MRWPSQCFAIESTVALRYQLTYSRAEYKDPKLTHEHFNTLLRVRSEYSIIDKDIYNFNETGFALEIITIIKFIYSYNRTKKTKSYLV